LDREVFSDLVRALPEVRPNPSGSGYIPLDEQHLASLQPCWRDYELNIRPRICAALWPYFSPYYTAKAQEAVGLPLEPVEPHSLRGIVQCRYPGHVQKPHVDKATTIFTFLLYLTPESSRHGTTLYSIAHRDELREEWRKRRNVRAWFPDITIYGIKEARTLEYRANRVVAFLNLCTSLHAVAYPSGPPRYAIQNYADFAPSIRRAYFRNWNDPLSPTGEYEGDL
jgi:hypothetical protein